MNEFRSKIKAPDGSHPKGIGQDSSILEWIKVNPDKTKFKDYKEAEDALNELIALHRECDKQYPEYSNLSIKAILLYGPDAIIDLQMEMINEYGYLLFDN